MKKITLLFPLVVAAMISCNNTTNNETTNTPKADSTPVAAAPAKEEAPPPAMDSATMTKKWMEYMTPGDMHKMMASWNGKWAADITSWDPMDPSKPPTQSKGVMDNKMILGGRYQLGMMKGEMMGMPFEGTSTMSYDNAKQAFVSTWIDNMGTGIMMLEGSWDAANKIMNLKGKMTDFTTGKDMDVREVFKIIDDKNQVMEMYCAGPDGKDFKNMEIKYSKK